MQAGQSIWCIAISSRQCEKGLDAEAINLMGFSDFYGNAGTVTRMREMLARGRFSSSAIMAGPEGAGKYTLALMMARAMNCLDQPVTGGLPDFCGQCANCTRIADALDFEAAFAAAVEAREA